MLFFFKGEEQIFKKCGSLRTVDSVLLQLHFKTMWTWLWKQILSGLKISIQYFLCKYSLFIDQQAARRKEQDFMCLSEARWEVCPDNYCCYTTVLKVSFLFSL